MTAALPAKYSEPHSQGPGEGGRGGKSMSWTLGTDRRLSGWGVGRGGRAGRSEQRGAVLRTRLRRQEVKGGCRLADLWVVSARLRSVGLPDTIIE